MESLKVNSISEQEIVSAAIFEYSVANTYDVGNFKFISVRSCYAGSFVFENLYFSKEDVLSLALLFYMSKLHDEPDSESCFQIANDLCSRINTSSDLNSLI